jgi:hypothetical protein
MTIGSILLGLALLVLVVMYIARPLLATRMRSRRQRRLGTRSRTSNRQSLLAHKEALLAQIHALDFDFETGKLPETDYRQQRELLMSEATAVLRQIDEMDGEIEAAAAAVPKQAVGGRKSDPDAEIEAAVARLRVSTPAVAAEVATEVVGEEPARAGNGQAKFCPQCGQPADPDDKFCAHCGHRLPQPQAA